MPRHAPIHRRRAQRAAALALLAIPAAAPSGAHAASIWTPVNSGTSETITAVAYRADKLIVGTANGNIFSGGVLRQSYPGQAISDLELNPSGTAAIATLATGKAVRSSDGGLTWSAAVQLQSYAPSTSCQSSPSSAVPLSNLTTANAVRWTSDTGAYIASGAIGSVLRTANGGASWSEVSRKSDQTCAINTPNEITDIAPVAGSLSVYAIDKSFGRLYFSADAYASPASSRATSVNCFSQKPALAVDSTDSTRLASADGCEGGLSLQYSEDGGSTFNYPQIAPDTVRVNGLNDVDFVGGTIVWAGKGGDLFTSRNGRTAYAQKVEGADATRDWRSVSGYDGTHFAVGGTGGALYVTASATNIPDLIAPNGTINEPGTVFAGVPKQFTATLLDETGGSGIDPASIRWSAAGIPDATGNPATITFPSATYVTLKVTFKDLAGNPGEAQKSFFVETPTGGTPGALGTPSNPIPSVNKTVSGVTVGVPPKCVSSGASFSTSMALRRQLVIKGKVVTLKRVDFWVDGKRVKSDTKAPFRQVLSVNAASGTKHTFKAVGYLKRKGNKGAAIKRTVNSTFSIC